ncbi:MULTISPECIES: hypothetical protein [unclassified Novosphingobium]|uniref:hypothetical protein n=1 Tax=unclassified Novosphingobium TaxID=2644732 RepID=UPI000D32216F|nr:MULTISPECIES: hypothetical protein [unclassified Novosphingobium]PTR06399.1 hypothetical protein C8K11_12012 [Novosphingobium sp. GV055]PUA94818.1 hypothetical protein C8K12_12012 [Novosphingobium sp. GV061]PUB13743.1 hypothetical protein C8K14_12012 [Novosphingobium sp. GV079]PUB38441.1 hypothetical protein C8K10_12012 [Novosphingobium sp. GV027]
MTHHHPVAFVVIIATALTLLAVAAAAPRIAGIPAAHALPRAAVGLAGLLMMPFFILTLEAFIYG